MACSANVAAVVAIVAAGFDPEAPMSMDNLVPGTDVSVAVTGKRGIDIGPG